MTLGWCKVRLKRHEEEVVQVTEDLSLSTEKIDSHATNYFGQPKHCRQTNSKADHVMTPITIAVLKCQLYSFQQHSM